MKNLLWLLMAVFGVGCSEVGSLPELNAELETAVAKSSGNELTVSTGHITRTWLWTGNGLATVQVESGGLLERSDEPPAADWSFPFPSSGELQAELLSLTAEVSTDQGFTDKHLAVTAEILYPEPGFTARYTIWAYPDASGLRTQLWWKGEPTEQSLGVLPPEIQQGEGQVDRIPIDAKRGYQIRAFGYYNDTQHRHAVDTPLIRDEVLSSPDRVDWANAYSFDDGHRGFFLVKESHKCVNQSGVATGAFEVKDGSLVSSGWGLKPSEISSERFSWCWASWLVGYDASSTASRALALKEFDTRRYPVDLERDMYLKANTWGSDNAKTDSQSRAQESEILAELSSVADLGLGALQVDDGWQMPLATEGSSSPPAELGWKPHPERWPSGWKPAVDKAEKLGIHLGLWAAAQSISLDELKWNYEHGRFLTWKLDFAALKTYAQLAEMLEKGRAFVAFTGHKAQITWDVTENAPRYGYYWARECGCIWLANRKPMNPASVVPQPTLMLREAWQLARYLPMNKFQLPVQNFARVNRKVSDAYLYPETYAVALGFPGIPVFFQTTRFYDLGQRKSIKPLIAAYKSVQEKLFTSYVFPLGSEPNGRSWSGFQWYQPKREEGFLLLFRERLNENGEREIPIHFLEPGRGVKLEDLLTGDVRNAVVGPEGSLPFTIPRPAEILFLKISPTETGE